MSEELFPPRAADPAAQADRPLGDGAEPTVPSARADQAESADQTDQSDHAARPDPVVQPDRPRRHPGGYLAAIANAPTLPLPVKRKGTSVRETAAKPAHAEPKADKPGEPLARRYPGTKRGQQRIKPAVPVAQLRRALDSFYANHSTVAEAALSIPSPRVGESAPSEGIAQRSAKAPSTPVVASEPSDRPEPSADRPEPSAAEPAGTVDQTSGRRPSLRWWVIACAVALILAAAAAVIGADLGSHENSPPQPVPPAAVRDQGRAQIQAAAAKAEAEALANGPVANARAT